MDYNLGLSLVEPGRPATESSWTDDDAAASDARALRNEAIAAALCAAIPSLAPVADRSLDAYELMEDNQPAEVMIRRFHRLRVLEGPSAIGTMRLLVMDGLIDATLFLGVAGDAGALERLLAQEIATLARASGHGPVLAGQPVSPKELAAHLVARNAAALHRRGRNLRWRTLLDRAGVPSLVLLTLLALLAAAAAVQDGVSRGRLVVLADATRPMTFVTTAVLPPVMRLGLFPRFQLEGVVRETGERVRVDTYRDVVLRAGPGAPFTVLPLRESEPAYVLMSQLESAHPVVAVGTLGIAWPALLALLPMGLWGWLVLRPWLATPAPQRAVLRIATSRQALFVVQIGLLLAVALAARHFL